MQYRIAPPSRYHSKLPAHHQNIERLLCCRAAPIARQVATSAGWGVTAHLLDRVSGSPFSVHPFHVLQLSRSFDHLFAHPPAQPFTCSNVHTFSRCPVLRLPAFLSHQFLTPSLINYTVSSVPLPTFHLVIALLRPSNTASTVNIATSHHSEVPQCNFAFALQQYWTATHPLSWCNESNW